MGTRGIPIFCNILKTDRMDSEIIKMTLDTLIILCTKKTPQDLGSTLSEIFIKDPKNVSLLLDILSDSDFYVRFNCLQFLSLLLANVGKNLSDAILTSPTGISRYLNFLIFRLIDLLDDKREIIRNGTLALTKMDYYF